MQRVRIGLTGLAFVFVLVLLAAVFTSPTNEAPITANSIEQQMTPEYVRLFAETAAARRGVAVSAIRDGHCQACQVTVRPMQVMEARRGDHIVLCESCKRILYVPPPAAPAAPPGAPEAVTNDGGRG